MPTYLYILIPILFILAITISIFTQNTPPTKEKPKYRYTRRNCILTEAEHDFYNTLTELYSQKYTVFAQVHLPTLIDHTVPGQDWKPAFNHINQKSIDFVLCNTVTLSPLVAIEYDDRSHERRDRKERDIEVENILESVGLPLVRIQNHGKPNPEEIKEKIAGVLG